MASGEQQPHLVSVEAVCSYRCTSSLHPVVKLSACMWSCKHLHTSQLQVSTLSQSAQQDAAWHPRHTLPHFDEWRISTAAKSTPAG